MTKTNTTPKSGADKATQTPADFGERVEQATEDLCKRRSAILQDARCTTEQAVLAEWLFASNADPLAIAVPVREGEGPRRNDFGGFDRLRERFEHRLTGVNDEELERFRGVIRVALETLNANDAEGIRIIGDKWEELLEIDTAYKKLILALEWTSGAVRFAREGGDYERWVPPHMLQLTAIDPALGRLDPDKLLDAIRCNVLEVKSTWGKWGGPALLEWILVETGAFGVKRRSDAKKKIENAQKTHKRLKKWRKEP